MDPLSDVLGAIRLKGAVFFDVHASEPWVAETPPGDRIVGSVFPGSDHVMSYHVVTQGSCWAYALDEAPRRIASGDLILFPHGSAHVISSAPGMRATPDMSLYRPPADGRPFIVTMGEGEEHCRLTCGFFGCDVRPFNPLLAALPPVIHLTGGAAGTIGELMRFAASESKQPRIGGACVLGRVSELMFVDVVRRHLESLPDDRTGWLAGLRDPHVGRAIAALHAAPARAWTLEALAHEAGLSRSGLAERFASLVGQPPVQYLTSWRMQIAATLLMNGAESLGEVASRVGYESEAAFSRAFKKAVGVPPGQWRRHRASDTARATVGV